MITLTYGFGVGLAGLAGVLLAAPICRQSGMGPTDHVVFAVVVIGAGLDPGLILTGFGLAWWKV
jgi:branched-chain amino acid transport system permease protein